MFWVDSELGSDIYLMVRSASLFSNVLAFHTWIQCNVLLSFKARFQRMFETHDLGSHIPKFDYGDPLAYSDAFLSTW